jgi:hypothetical protein
MADERRRCSYFEPGCRMRDRLDPKSPVPAVNTGGAYPVPPRGVNTRTPQHGMVLPGHI